MKKIWILAAPFLLCAACSMKVTSKDEAPAPEPTVVDSPKQQGLSLSKPGANTWNHVVITDFSKVKDETLGFMFNFPNQSTGKVGLSSVSYTGCLEAEAVFQLVELKDSTIVAAVPMSVWTSQTVSPEKQYAVLVGIRNFKSCKSLYVDFMVDHRN